MQDPWHNETKLQQDRPDYSYLKGLFSERYIAEGYDKEPPTFDWTHKIKAKESGSNSAAAAGGAAAAGEADVVGAVSSEEAREGAKEAEGGEGRSTGGGRCRS